MKTKLGNLKACNIWLRLYDIEFEVPCTYNIDLIDYFL